MFEFLKGFFSGRDDERREDPRKQNALNKLEMDEPMAGAGAQVSAEHEPTETEESQARKLSRARLKSSSRNRMTTMRRDC